MKKIPKYFRNIKIIIGFIVTILLTVIYILDVNNRLFPSCPELKCKISREIIINEDTLQAFSNQPYNYILEKRYINASTSTINLDKVTYCEIKITNVGNKVLTFNDIYKYDPLKIIIKGYGLIGVCINKKTPIYIGARIDTNIKDEIFIFFDRINPKDSILLKFLLEDVDRNPSFQVYGSSDYFKRIKPVDNDTAWAIGSYEDLELSHHIYSKIIIALSILGLTWAFALLIFITKRNKKKTNINKKNIK